MKKTIAQQLGVTDFPFQIKDKKGNVIYIENENGLWQNWKTDKNGKCIYYEDALGQTIDNRPKPQAEPMTIEIDGKRYKLTEL